MHKNQIAEFFQLHPVLFFVMYTLESTPVPTVPKGTTRLAKYPHCSFLKRWDFITITSPPVAYTSIILNQQKHFRRTKTQDACSNEKRKKKFSSCIKEHMLSNI